MNKKIKGVNVMYIPSSKVLKVDDECEKMIVVDIFFKNLTKEKIRNTTIYTSRNSLDIRQFMTAVRGYRSHARSEDNARQLIKIHDCQEFLDDLKILAEYLITNMIIDLFKTKDSDIRKFKAVRRNEWSVNNLIRSEELFMNLPEELKISFSKYGAILDPFEEDVDYASYELTRDVIRHWEISDLATLGVDTDYIRTVILEQTFENEDEIKKYLKANMNKIFVGFNTIRVDSKALLDGKFDTGKFVKDFNGLKTAPFKLTEADAMLYLKNYLNTIQVFKKFNS